MESSLKGYLQRRILYPLYTIIAVLTLLFAGVGLWHANDMAEHEAMQQATTAQSLFDTTVDNLSNQMRAMLQIIARDAELKEAFIARDRARLHSLIKPIYEVVRNDHNITHLYFFSPERVNFLRAHHPSRYGDHVERIVINQAELSGESASGMEIGALGTYTLRVALPWYQQSELIGFIEMGVEIEHIAGVLRKTLDSSVFVLLDKSNINRPLWEEGNSLLDRESNWNNYERYVLTNDPKQPLPLPLRPIIDAPIDELPYHQTLNIDTDEYQLKATLLPLTDVQNRRVGAIALVTPIKAWLAPYWRDSMGIAALFVIGGLLMLWRFRAGVLNAERSLEQHRNDIRRMSQRWDLERHDLLFQLQHRDEQQEKLFTQLSQQEKKLKHTLQLSGLGICEWSQDDETLHGSERFIQLTGLKRKVGHYHLSDFIAQVHRDDRSKVENALRHNHKQGKIQSLQFRCIDTSGSELTVRLSYQLVTEKSAIFAIIEDVSELEHNLQELSQLKHIFDNASNEIYVIDANRHTILQTNRTTREHLGDEGRDITDANYLDIAAQLTPGQFSRLVTPLRLGKKREVRYETVHHRHDGSLYHIDGRIQLSELDGREVYILIVLDVSERVEQQQAIDHQAHHDPLTGLPNRPMLLRQLERELGRAERNRYPLLLAHININDFGTINDTLGHDNGDQVLRQFGERLAELVGGRDLLARIGGDEFVVLQPEQGLEGVDEFMERLGRTIAQPFATDDFHLNIEASSGIAIYPDHAEQPQELMQRANVALKRAKTVHSDAEVYNTEDDPYSMRRLMINSHLRHAVEREELSLHFQPKVSAVDFSVHEVEALLRWNSKELGPVSPGEFIPLAERTGIIRHLTSWVLEEAARHLDTWHKEGLDLRINVNLSASSLQDPDLSNKIVSLVERWGIDPNHLGLEITESAAMIDPDYTIAILSDLSSMGHSLSIDDYGTGYSSLTYLQKLPVTELKIDGSFIKKMLDDEDSEVIVRSTIKMAHNLGLEVTSEGVETKAQAAMLAELNSDLLQGFYFSKPMPGSELVSWLKSREQQNNLIEA